MNAETIAAHPARSLATPAAEPASPALRPSTDADLPAMHAIYRHHVMTGLASFEDEPPSLEEFAQRRAAVLALGLPWLVATAGEGGEILGYAYLGLYRPRSAYRYTVEDSVYVAPQGVGRGVGRRLIAALVEQAAALGYRQVLAVIGDSGNLASIRAHAACGFREAGRLEAIGFKFGRWVDSVIMQRTLADGAETIPSGPPAHRR
ncbi:GNAT family N-acetyltransferase [Elioraea rosea]|uniref:GNAT family N-acetyltransferase n=1 Tax=Elioraea rosea TaxID=2492390 RepID=UPI00118412C8|nr:GNAT family N-acetyltransferase [Elioraea rosea]